MRRSNVIVLALAASSVAGLAALPQTAAAKPKRPKPARSHIVEVVTPLGLQGTSGSGGNVVIPFKIADIGGRPADIEVQYGVDLNGDGMIAENEYRRASEDRLDYRDTRENRAPQLFRTGSTVGAVNAFVWQSLADVGRARLVTLEYALTPQGRQIPDPNNPGAFLFASGPGGAFVQAGVKVRMRTALRRKRHGPWVYSEWTYSDTFALDNSLPPSMTIDATTSGATVLVVWTAFDADSEDLNGNGLLDIANGEDMDGDGVLDCEKVGAAFDYHRLAPGEDPATMSAFQLSSLQWRPCTRSAGVGDTDSLDSRPGVPIPASGDLSGVCSGPPGVGHHWLFAWDAVADEGVTTDRFILRATPFDQERNRGATVYSWIVVHE
jgi:hypothetical protein